MRRSRKYVWLIAIGAIAIVMIVWKRYASTTKIALYNFPTYQVSNISLSNNDRFIQFDEVEKIEKLKKYDFVLIFGMGLKINEDQRNNLVRIVEKKFLSIHFQLLIRRIIFTICHQRI